MPRRSNKYKPNENFEFELDLAPLLAVMVKLVPVLLVSSAFIEMMVIETELPQAVQQAVEDSRDKDDQVFISMAISNKNGITIAINKNGAVTTENIANLKEGEFNLSELNKKLALIKKTHPNVFKLSISPDSDVNYKQIVKIMDESRKTKDRTQQFPVFDKKLNKEVYTDYMFPEIEFANIMEG